MCVSTLIFANDWSQVKQICLRNFHPLGVVGRGSETQLQVGGNLNKVTRRERVNKKYTMCMVCNAKRRKI